MSTILHYFDFMNHYGPIIYRRYCLFFENSKPPDDCFPFIDINYRWLKSNAKSWYPANKVITVTEETIQAVVQKTVDEEIIITDDAKYDDDPNNKENDNPNIPDLPFEKTKRWIKKKRRKNISVKQTRIERDVKDIKVVEKIGTNYVVEEVIVDCPRIIIREESYDASTQTDDEIKYTDKIMYPSVQGVMDSWSQTDDVKTTDMCCMTDDVEVIDMCCMINHVEEEKGGDKEKDKDELYISSINHGVGRTTGKEEDTNGHIGKFTNEDNDNDDEIDDSMYDDDDDDDLDHWKSD